MRKLARHKGMVNSYGGMLTGRGQFYFFHFHIEWRNATFRSVIILVTEEAAHVDVLLFFLLLLLNGSLSGGTGTSGGGGASGGSSGDVGEHVTDVGTLKGLNEEHRPVGLDGVAGGSDHLGELLSLKDE